MTVVVTGIGMLTAVGDTAEECWSKIAAGESGLSTVGVVPHSGLLSTRAGEVRSKAVDEDPTNDRCIVLSRIALEEALTSAGLIASNPYESHRTGLAIGTSLGGARRGEEFHRQWLTRGLRQANTGLLRQYPLHSTADYLAGHFKLFGPRTVHSNACAAGSVAIANGLEYLRTDAADMVVVGGVDPLAYLSFGGFSCLGALSPRDCAPYSKSEGLTLGEGAGFLVLERVEAAHARNASVLAVLSGYGLSADAHHPTAPDPRGRGALSAMTSALEMAGATEQEIDYINGHGTGTPANDGGEKKILMHLGEHNIPMSSTKSMIGHTLGAAGAVEAVTTVMALREQVLPPTVIPEDFEGDLDFDAVPHSGRPAKISLALSNSFAFGGNNSTLVFRNRDNQAEQKTPPTRKVAITAMGAMVGTAGTSNAIADALFSGVPLYGNNSVSIDEYGPFPIAEIPESVQKSGINPTALRRLDALSKRSASVVGQLLKERSLSRNDVQKTGLIFATASGPMSTVEAFQRGLITDGVGNTRLFPNTVMNASAGHVALLHGLKGPTATFCAGSTSAVSALHFGQQLIASRACDRVIVLSADETSTALLAGYARIEGYLSQGVLVPFGNSGRIYSGAAAAVLLEPDEGQQIPALGRILGFGFAGDDSGCGNVKQDSTAWCRAMSHSIRAAGLENRDIDVIVAAASGRSSIDDLERKAILDLGLGEVPVSAPKAMLGDTQSTAALLGVHQSMWMKSRGEAVATDYFGNKHDASAEIDKNRPLRVLVNSMEIGGNYQSVVVEV
ncbi:beta-ketoacyl-[acyl-carrier-protein] synthase family protein [Arthrobacter sp. efr-133-R2A-120]|uniref:beta-ketoacyl-[acyl-carrier-protein] synthase family protein n=1 Tax=Arthrobacter sp. efr-133-R2A-120 TaxID=3040277 RepID=UPI00255165CC|nr:beta-ketoacyl-[acyl-carrier-protein] synthase family protein [Arthrobacter sp. efr-133-R2A-120]